MRSSWEAPIGDARLNRALRRQQEQEQSARQTAEFAREPGSPSFTVSPGALPGDEFALRGIPAIGRGVQGVIRWTQPGDGIR